MKIDVHTAGGIVTVRPSGKLDATTAQLFEDAINQVLQQDALRIVVDMSDVPYVSSAGLRVFVVAARRLMGTGKLAAAALQSNVQHAFELAGFTRIMHVCENLEEARECFA